MFDSFFNSIISIFPDVIGHIASIAVAFSISQTNIRRLRYWNVLGASLMALYGFSISSKPVLFLNIYIVTMDVFYIIKMKFPNIYFSLTENVSLTSSFLQDFLNYHKKDISHYFPTFDFPKLVQEYTDLQIFFIHRNFNIAGVLITRCSGDTMWIYLDYATKAYRDLRNTTYFLNKRKDVLSDKGIKFLASETTMPVHQKFLKQMGFQTSDNRVYKKNI